MAWLNAEMKRDVRKKMGFIKVMVRPTRFEEKWVSVDEIINELERLEQALAKLSMEKDFKVGENV